MVFRPLGGAICDRSERGPTCSSYFCSITDLTWGDSATVTSEFFSSLLERSICSRCPSFNPSSHQTSAFREAQFIMNEAVIIAGIRNIIDTG